MLVAIAFHFLEVVEVVAIVAAKATATKVVV